MSTIVCVALFSSEYSESCAFKLSISSTEQRRHFIDPGLTIQLEYGARGEVTFMILFNFLYFTLENLILFYEILNILFQEPCLTSAFMLKLVQLVSDIQILVSLLLQMAIFILQKLTNINRSFQLLGFKI